MYRGRIEMKKGVLTVYDRIIKGKEYEKLGTVFTIITEFIVVLYINSDNIIYINR